MILHKNCFIFIEDKLRNKINLYNYNYNFYTIEEPKS